MTKIATHARSGLPILPEGYHYQVKAKNFDGETPVVVGIVEGGVSKNSAWVNSGWLDSIELNESWHWLVRWAARRLYRRNVFMGEWIERTPKSYERWNDRYDLIKQYREENDLV